MTMVRRPVHPALEGLVADLVGFDLSLPQAAVHYGEPGTGATLLIALERPFDVGWVGEPSQRWQTLVSGLHTRPALIRTHGRQFGLQLSLTPRGCRALLGLPIGELAHHLVPVTHLSQLFPGALLDQLPDMGWDDRLAAVESALVAQVGGEGVVRSEVQAAWGLLERAGGNVQVNDLAHEMGWSRRHLSKVFTAEIGIGIKQAARIHRFARARSLIQVGWAPAQVAVRCGYADQAHLTREWRALAGQTPARWEAFPILQDG